MINLPQSPSSAGSLRAAWLTPRGRGAVATIRVQGDHTFLDGESSPVFRAANGRPLADQPIGRIVFGAWGQDCGEAVVLCRLDPMTLEIHGHGGDRAAERILADCRRIGAEIVDWQRLTESTADRLEVEIQEALSRAITWRTAESLLCQADGRLRMTYERLARIEWSETGRRQAGHEISELLRWADFGVHLTQPWRVVLTGRPNVGKSSLINALLGYQRSIVFDQPGTTRDVVTAETALDGWPVQLADTAGLRDAAESLEAEGIASARRQLADADLIVELIDLSEPEGSEGGGERGDERRMGNSVGIRSRLLVAHKCDLPDLWGDALPTGALRVSSITGFGVEDLQREISRRLVPGFPPVETPVPITPRQVAVLRTLQSELSAAAETRYRTASAALLTG